MRALGIAEGPDMDEVSKVLMQKNLGKREQNARNEIFFCLLGTIVGLNITNNATNENDMSLLFATGAHEAMQSYILKEYTTSVVFYSTENNAWPPSFVEFLSVRQAEEPSAKWCSDKGIADKTDSVKKLHYYGHRLLTSFKGCKTYISNVLNPIWNLLPTSGVLQSSLFNWTRSKAIMINSQKPRP